MNCTEVQERFLALVDGESDPPAERHLMECAVCRREFVNYHRIIAGLSALPPVKPRNDISQAVWNRIDARRRLHRLTAGITLPLVGAAAMALLVLGDAPQETVENTAMWEKPAAPPATGRGDENARGDALTAEEHTDGQVVIVRLSLSYPDAVAVASDAALASLRLRGEGFRVVDGPPFEDGEQTYRVEYPR